MSAAFKSSDFFVAPDGRDPNNWSFWTGKLAAPNDDGDDGPFATVEAARDAIRRLRETGTDTGPVTVWIRGGRYHRTHPITFGPKDSGPVTYAAYPGEEPIFDGGVRIDQWQIEKRNGIEVWRADVSGLLTRDGNCCQLFVSGARRPRARLPRTGFFIIDKPAKTDPAPALPANARRAHHFTAHDGDLTAAHTLDHAQIVTLCAWIADRLPITAFDPDTRLVTVQPTANADLDMDSEVLLLDSHHRDLVMAEERRRMGPCIDPDLAYYVENVPEALTEPGDWYLDQSAGELWYVPLPDEDPAVTEAYVSYIPQLLLLRGDPDTDRPVQFLTFRGLAFEHTDWIEPIRSRQGDHNMPGVIRFEGAHACSIEQCRIAHVGWHAIELADGCMGNRIVGNTLTDLGAGGIKVNGADIHGTRARRTGNNRITDNEIGEGGVVFHASIGVLLMHTYGNEVSHNHIHDFRYGGITCGWTWGYGEGISRENRILQNHIHDIGRCPWKRGLLADLGGIYLLGVQPGTTIKGNIVHDVYGDSFAWGIYLDMGCAHMLIEDNICWGTDEAFHVHFGRENIVRNNIFLSSGNAVVSIMRGPFDYQYRHGGPNTDCEFTMERNILVAEGCPFYLEYMPREHEHLEDRPFRSDMNICWEVSGQALLWAAQGFDVNHREHGFEKTFDLAAWRAIGYDLCSVLADPGFADAANRDFSLEPDSPALRLGFRPIDTSDNGPRQ